MAMDPESPGNLEEQVRELRSRVQLLEDALRVRGIVPLREPPAASPAKGPVLPQAAAPPVSPGYPPQFPSPPPTATSAPAYAPQFTFAQSETPHDTRSLESRVGSQWFNRIGILAVLIGMAWFLKFAIDNEWIGPLGRIVIGLIAGAGLIGWSERFRAKNYVAFSYSLKAVGTGILYLSLWAAFSMYHLIPSSVAFVAMIAVTAFNGYLAWVQDSELLALYAIVGGLSTPLLVSTGENHEIALFSYLLMLDIAVLILVILRPWSRLLFGAFLGTVLFVLGWWAEFYSQPQAGRTAFFLICFFLIFAFAPRLVRPKFLDSGALSGWETFAVVILPLCNAALGFIAFYGLLDYKTAEWAAPWLAVLFAAFYLALLRLPAAGLLNEGRLVLNSLHLSTAVVFLTIALPLKAHGRWLTIGWLVEGAALLWTARRNHSQLLRILSLICLGLGLFAVIAINPGASTVPIFNERFGTNCVAIAVFAFVAWLANHARNEDSQFVPSWTGLAATSVLMINLLILYAVGWEIHSFWWSRLWHGDIPSYHSFAMYAQFTYSAFFMTFGAVLLGIGFWRRSAFLRWQALVILAVSIGKVFLVDTSELSQGFRILSFLGLGVLLLAVSFVYQRDWLNLRSHGGETS